MNTSPGARPDTSLWKLTHIWVLTHILLCARRHPRGHYTSYPWPRRAGRAPCKGLTLPSLHRAGTSSKEKAITSPLGLDVHRAASVLYKADRPPVDGLLFMFNGSKVNRRFVVVETPPSDQGKGFWLHWRHGALTTWHRRLEATPSPLRAPGNPGCEVRG